METQLKGEYREVFAKAQAYTAIKNIEDAFAQDKLLELFDLLLTAQDEGKPVSRLVGNDANVFCKNYFSDYTIVERLRFLPVSIYRVAWFVFIIEMLGWLASDHPIRDFFTLKSDITGYGFGLLVACVTYIITDTVLAHFFSKKNNIKPGVWYFLIFAVMALILGLSFTLSDKITMMLPVMLPVYPFLLGSGLYIVVYIIVRAIWRCKNYGSVLNTGKQIRNDSYYRNLEDRDLEKIVLEAWQKRYHRLVKKGKTTEEDYLERLKKDEANEKIWLDYILPAIYVVLCVGATVGVAVDSGFWDTLLFAVLIIAVEYGVYRWMTGIERKNAALRTKHLDRCERRGITMPVYIEEALNDFE